MENKETEKIRDYIKGCFEVVEPYRAKNTKHMNEVLEPIIETLNKAQKAVDEGNETKAKIFLNILGMSTITATKKLKEINNAKLN